MHLPPPSVGDQVFLPPPPPPLVAPTQQAFAAPQRGETLPEFRPQQFDQVHQSAPGAAWPVGNGQAGNSRRDESWGPATTQTAPGPSTVWELPDLVTPEDVQLAAELAQTMPAAQAHLLAEQARAEANWAAGEFDLDEHDIDMTRMSVRHMPAKAWNLVLPDGQRVPIRGSVLVGRAASADDRWPDAELVSVYDPTKSMSKTHVKFESDPLGLTVIDLYSLNGTMITRPDGEVIDLQDGQRARVESGCTIELGDYMMQVERH